MQAEIIGLGSPRMSPAKMRTSLKWFNLDFAERDPSSMGLQPDKTGYASRAGLATCWIGVVILGDYYAIEKHGIVLSLGMNFEFIPFTHRFYRKIIGIIRRGEAVDRAGLANGRTLGTRELVDLDLEPEINRDVGGIVVIFAIRVRKADEHTGIVILTPAQPLKFKHEILRCRVGMPEHAQVVAWHRFQGAIHEQTGRRDYYWSDS